MKQGFSRAIVNNPFLNLSARNRLRPTKTIIMKYLQGFAGKIMVCRGFKRTLVVTPNIPLTFWFGGPQPALGVPNATLIGCSSVLELTNWDPHCSPESWPFLVIDRVLPISQHFPIVPNFPEFSRSFFANERTAERKRQPKQASVRKRRVLGTRRWGCTEEDGGVRTEKSSSAGSGG